MKVTFQVNGTTVSVETEPLTRLLDILRAQPGLTGTKEGCGEGECGACAVLLNGEVVNSCLLPAGSLEGASVTTIEGLRDTARYSTLEDSFGRHGGVQCGFCTPGFMIASAALLRENPSPADAAIRVALSGNLCRCTGYTGIIEAVKSAGRIPEKKQ